MTETTKKSNGKKIALAVAVLAVVVAVFAIVYVNFKPKAVEGAKTVTIEVVDNNETSTVYEVHTDAEFFQQAMDEADGLTYGGTESEYGLMVDTINDIRADYTEDGAYWAFYVNGEYCMYGIAEQPVLDGEAYQIVYTLAE